MTLFSTQLSVFYRRKNPVEQAPPVVPPVTPPPLEEKMALTLNAPLTELRPSVLRVTFRIDAPKPAQEETTVYVRITYPAGNFVTGQSVLLKNTSVASLTTDLPRLETDSVTEVKIIEANEYTIVASTQNVFVQKLEPEFPETPVVPIETYAAHNTTLKKSQQEVSAGKVPYVAAVTELLDEINDNGLLTKAPYTLAGSNPVTVRDYKFDSTINANNGRGAYVALNNGDGTPKMITWPYAPLTAAEADRTYYNLRTYWGPTEPNSILNGMPFTATGRDKITFPLVNVMLSNKRVKDMSHDLRLLGLGYTFLTGTNKTKCAEQVVAFIRAFYTSTTTGMYPHLLFGQVAKGSDDNFGNSTGFVDMEEFVHQIDALNLIRDFTGFTEADKIAIRAWVEQMLEWSTKRYNPVPTKTENIRAFYNHRIVGQILNASNNIRILYEAYVLSMMLYLGRKEDARNRVNTYAKQLMELAFSTSTTRPSGRAGEPIQETKRAAPWTYAIKNLGGWIRYCTIAEFAGVDVWNMEAANGASFKENIRFMAYFAQNQPAWAAWNTAEKDIYSTSLIYYFRSGARVATAKYASDTELMGWVNNYLAKLEAAPVSSRYKESGFRAGQDYNLLTALYGKPI